MLEIVEQKNMTSYRELLEQIAAPAETRLYLTEALDKGEVLGYIVYAYEPEQVAVYAVNDGGDMCLCDGLVRSVLFKAELRGLERAVYPLTDEAMLQRIRSLHLAQNDGNVLENIHEIMESCKKCKESR